MTMFDDYTVGGVEATDDVMYDDVPTDDVGGAPAGADDRAILKRAWTLVVGALLVLWALGMGFHRQIQG